MASIILLHGAFTGGWLWRFTAQALDRLGHDVHRPSLTGCGERAHLLRPEISLAMHVQDAAQLLFHEDLDRTLLVGHGYGGLIAQALAHRHSAKVAGVVLLDGALAERGKCYAEAAGRADLAVRAMPASADWLVPPPPPESFGLTCREAARWLSVRLQPFPRACLTDPYPYGGRGQELPRFLVRTALPGGAKAAPAARAALSRVKVVEFQGGPLPMVNQAGTLAELLSGLAGAISPAREAGAGEGSAPTRRGACRRGGEDL
ncbi:Pyrethroid hydrolase [Fundidesulfovibrio magnetotacticus]|uniref:Pyrethroid hydrolase n=1 Tax=Fundidesulfovibrio magnetotacticus TaxID=2730080 RepID=A0A6V8LY80_9BACT|nr:alpha/beta fold hydrolase [Fundidesulfovibrio magnetotacticus]GFK95780.1 Pyrethroid hydrolase [Fundidesulfovibrio magnetotacticus]